MKITLNTGSLAMFDSNEPFVLPDTLDIEIISPIYRLESVAISVRNNGETKKYTLKQKPFNLNLKDLKAGRLELEISALVNGEPVKSWRVPDIILKEVNHTFEAIPEIEAIKRELTTLKQGIAEILKLI